VAGAAVTTGDPAAETAAPGNAVAEPRIEGETAASTVPKGIRPPAAFRRVTLSILAVLGAFASLASLVLLAGTAQDAGRFDELQPWLLAINLAGVLVLVALIGRKLYELIHDWRAQVPGSRMKARAVLNFSGLALVPILIVYFFSVNAINRGIDSWFSGNVGRGLDDALALSRAALSLRMREFSGRTGKLAEELGTAREFELPSQLDRYRRIVGAAELIVVGDHGHIVAASTDFSSEKLPGAPADEVLLEARQGRNYVSLDPGPGGGYRVMTATALAPTAAHSVRVGALGAEDVRHRRFATGDGSGLVEDDRVHPLEGLQRLAPANLPAAVPEVDVHADADDRAADLRARRGLRGVLLGGTAGEARAGPDRGHPRGGQGRPQYPAATPVSR